MNARKMRNQRTALYRHYNATGTLLYVGISLSAVTRLSGHKHSPWFQEITKIEVEHFPNRKAACKAEAAAVAQEHPLYNKALKPVLVPLKAVYEVISGYRLKRVASNYNVRAKLLKRAAALWKRRERNRTRSREIYSLAQPLEVARKYCINHA